MIRAVIAVVLSCWLAVATCVAAADRPRGSGTLEWRAGGKGVDAAIESWPVGRVIATIARATGWETYVEPNTDERITVRFEGLDPPAALRRLLGGLNFALLPQVKGPSKLFVYRQSIADATRLVSAAAVAPPATEPGRAIPDELIVRRRSGAGEDVDRLASRLGGRVIGRVDGLDAYRLAFEDAATAREARAALAADPGTESVEDNVVLPPPETLIPITASPASPFPLARDYSPSSDQVVVGLIDSAVQAEGSSLQEFLREGLSLYGEYRPPADELTHGTAMAATILDGVARALRERDASASRIPLSILPVDVYGPNPNTTTFDVAQGVYQALGQRVNVVNLSLGSDTDSPLLRGLIGEAARRGVLFVAAAGNDGRTRPIYPAADAGVISVTAGDPQGGIAGYANRGPWVDAMAPGINVIQYLDRSWYGAGTSFAASWVSGWAAGYMAFSRRGPAAVGRQTVARWGLPTK
jgi:hypothetical protein